VVEVFGAHGLIQRCREHKKRNVTDALPTAARRGPQRDESGLRDARHLSAPAPARRSPVRDFGIQAITSGPPLAQRAGRAGCDVPAVVRLRRDVSRAGGLVSRVA